MDIGVENKINSFTDLLVWKEAHKLVVTLYKTLNSFPKHEQYALNDQMRRCAVSVTSNIAEGFSRQGTKDKLRFYFMSKGSLTELQNQLMISRDVGYLSAEKYQEFEVQLVTVGKLLTGLIKSLRSR